MGVIADFLDRVIAKADFGLKDVILTHEPPRVVVTPRPAAETPKERILP
jgi:hypothetical protein